MLVHNPQLLKAWRKAKKRKGDYKDIVLLDMRFNTSRDFMSKLGGHLQENINEGIQEMQGYNPDSLLPKRL